MIVQYNIIPVELSNKMATKCYNHTSKSYILLLLKLVVQINHTLTVLHDSFIAVSVNPRQFIALKSPFYFMVLVFAISHFHPAKTCRVKTTLPMSLEGYSEFCLF